MRLKYLNKTTLIILLTVALVSCKKINLVPTDKYTDLNFWTVNGNAFNALSTCYQQQISGGYSGSSSPSQEFFQNEALTDNGYCPLDVNVGTPTSIASGNDAVFNSGINRVRYEWGSLYTNIRSCNLFLANIDQNTTLGAPLIARMKAEARFLRAHAYLRLTQFFGDVPLVTDVLSVDESKSIAKSPKATVVAYIISELNAAAAALPRNVDQAAADRGRATKGAALALKARVQLYNGLWADCAATCEDLMNNQATEGTYALQASYEKVFGANNKYNSEVIFALGYVPSVRVWTDWNTFGPAYIGPGVAYNVAAQNLVPTQDLVESFLTLDGKGIFEAGSGYDENNAPYVNRDPRLGYTVVYDKYQWVSTPGSTPYTIYIKPGTDPVQPAKNEYSPSTVRTASGYYWRKYYDYSIQDGTSNYSEDIIILRYADILLMDAEARQQLGTFDATVWNNTIKPLRVRAGFVNPLALNYPGNTTMSMQDQIRNERRSELSFESLRYDDIKRWKIAEVVLNHPDINTNFVRGAKFANGNTSFIKITTRVFNPAKHYLWPIPSESLQTDPALTQNPGW